MHGCVYLSGSADSNDFWPCAMNIRALTIFNKAEAGITAHCILDTSKKGYYIEYNYYLNDYYDLALDKAYTKADMIGIAQGYELFGKYNDSESW